VRKSSAPENLLALHFNAYRLHPEREYRFHPPSRYRFDFAFLASMLAIEVEGGIWSKGAHSRPKGIIRDITKGNLAVLSGWRVLRYTPEMIKDGTAIREIQHALGIGHQISAGSTNHRIAQKGQDPLLDSLLFHDERPLG
jgi:very-short-patch-repair endonuclease